MAFSANDLVNNILGSLDNFQGNSDSGQKAIPKYMAGTAAYRLIQSTLNQSSWNKLSFPYTFSIMNIETGKVSDQFTDFALPLNPQSINQSEPFALSIKPTQGGTSVNHGGNRYKDLSIGGTTGIAPFRGGGGVERSSGEGIFQPNELKYKSGYEVFIHLRNWFRTYYEFKKKEGVNAKDLRLVFKNYKDGEFLIVELTKFEMDRQSGKPFLYDYRLEFKVLSHYQFGNGEAKNNPFTDTLKMLDDALQQITTARGVFLRSQEILRQIESTYSAAVLEPLRATTLALKALLGVPLVAADIGSRAIVNTVSTANATIMITKETARFASLGLLGQSDTLNEINALLDKRKGSLKTQMETLKRQIGTEGAAALVALGPIALKMDSGLFPQNTLDSTAEEQRSSSELPRSYYEDAIENLKRVKANAEDFFNLGSTEYDDLFDRSRTLSADPSKTFTNEEYDVLNGFNEALNALYVILATTDLFKSTFDDKIQDMIQRFNGEISLQSNQAVKQIKLDAGITLERLAQQQLGDSNRWGEIAEVNNLKPPYIVDDRTSTLEGVLKPGDNILIPVPITNGFTTLPQGKQNKLTKNMSEMERSLGVDFKLTPDFDLSLTNSGDLELVAGAENMSQAMLLKLSYEPGEIMRHPHIGAGILPGRKFPNLNDIKDGITTTLLQDARVEAVENLFLTRESGTLKVTFNLKIKNVDIPIPVKLKL